MASGKPDSHSHPSDIGLTLRIRETFLILQKIFFRWTKPDIGNIIDITYPSGGQHKSYLRFVCDKDGCDKCPLRFQCITSNTAVMTESYLRKAINMSYKDFVELRRIGKCNSYYKLRKPRYRLDRSNAYYKMLNYYLGISKTV